MSNFPFSLSSDSSEEDIRVTSYIMGELDADERAEFEAVLASSTELQREVLATRRLVTALTAECAVQPQLRLTDTQRIRVLKEVSAPTLKVVEPARFERGAMLIGLAAAAAVVVSAVFFVQFSSRDSVENGAVAGSYAEGEEAYSFRIHVETPESAPSRLFNAPESSQHPTPQIVATGVDSTASLMPAPHGQSFKGEALTGESGLRLVDGTKFVAARERDSRGFVPVSQGSAESLLTVGSARDLAALENTLMHEHQRPAPSDVSIAALLSQFDFSSDAAGIRVETAPCPWAEGNLLALVVADAGQAPEIQFNPSLIASYRRLDGVSEGDGAASGVSGVNGKVSEKNLSKVAALYELVVRAEGEVSGAAVSGTVSAANPADDGVLFGSRDLFVVGGVGHESMTRVEEGGVAFSRASEDLRFASAVAAFGLLLQEDADVKGLTFSKVKSMVKASEERSPEEREKLIRMIEAAQRASR